MPVASCESVDITTFPGELMSGFIRPSLVGPRLEVDAIAPTVGSGLKHIGPTGLSQQSFVVYEPTVMASLATPGSPTLLALLACDEVNGQGLGEAHVVIQVSNVPFTGLV